GAEYDATGFLRMDDYFFLHFYLSNYPETTIIEPNVTAECHLVKPSVVEGFNGWQLVDSYTDVPSSSRAYTFTLKKHPENVSQASWTDLYVYRWRKPAKPDEEADAPRTRALVGAVPVTSVGKTNTAETSAKESGTTKTARPVTEAAAGRTKAPAGSGVERGTASVGGPVKAQSGARKVAPGVRVVEPVGKGQAIRDVRITLVEEVNRTGEVPKYDERREREWKNIRADYTDADEFDGNGFALLDKHVGNAGNGYFMVKACYEWEGAPSCATGVIDFSAPDNPGGYRPPVEHESPRGEGYLERQMAEKEGLLVNPDPLQRGSLERLTQKYNRKQAGREGVSNIKALPMWAVASVKNVATWGVMDLEADSVFPADRIITRGELVAGLVRLFDLESKAAAPSRDVGASHRYRSEIATAVELGIVETSGGAFAADQPLSREEASKVVYRGLRTVLGAKQLDAAAAKTVTYKDAGEVSAGARPAVMRLSSLGLFDAFTAGGSFKPGEGMTMAQAASVLDRIAQNLILGQR
ncbi:MAG: S-layer homology domain-containing protein, partial [Acidobacteriota bacterium]